MPEVQTTEPTPTEQWFRGHVMTRFFATVWWLVMVFITVCLIGSLIALAIDPRVGRLIGTVVTMLIFIPIGKEWPNWRRMGRMLRHGT